MGWDSVTAASIWCRSSLENGSRVGKWLCGGMCWLRHLDGCRGITCHIDGGEGDRVAELLEPLDVMPLEASGVQPVKVVGAQIGVGAAIAQHRVDHHEQ